MPIEEWKGASKINARALMANNSHKYDGDMSPLSPNDSKGNKGAEIRNQDFRHRRQKTQNARDIEKTENRLNKVGLEMQTSSLSQLSSP